MEKMKIYCIICKKNYMIEDKDTYNWIKKFTGHKPQFMCRCCGYKRPEVIKQIKSVYPNL